MKVAFSALAAATMLATVQAGPALAATELTLWINGECPPDTCIEKALVDGFQTANPDIHVNIVPQPPDNYFTTLRTSSVIGKGPDIAAMWAGQYVTQFAQYMTDVHQYIPADIITSTVGADFYSKDNNRKNVTYAVPLTSQWYIGFYNKKLFAESGIAKPPTTWGELTADSKILADHKVLPIINGAQPGSAQIQPVFEWSYLAAALPISDWGKLLDGSVAYSDPRLEAQVQKWNGLYTAGYINKDAFNYPGTVPDFKAGKAAMMLGGGSWQITELSLALGNDLAIMVPPYADQTQHALISLAGTGYAVMKYSKNTEAAGKFLNFILSDAGQTIIAKFDAPPREGFPTKSPLLNDLIKMTSDPNSKVYPMFDNFSQPAVTDAIYRNLALALVGQASPADALKAVDAAFASLPDDQKAASIKFGN